MSTAETAIDTPLPNDSNLQIIFRLLGFMRPFNGVMSFSLLARVVKFCGQAAVLGIAAASIGIYLQNSEPGVFNWGLMWTQVGWIALAGTVVAITSYLENYFGHYVAFQILMAFRNRFYYAIVPLAPAKTAKLQSGEAVGRVMTDCERIEPFYAHTVAPAIAAIFVPIIILWWCWTVHPQLVYGLAPFYLANTVLLPWLVSKLTIGQGQRLRLRQHPGRARHGCIRPRKTACQGTLRHGRNDAGRTGTAVRRRCLATRTGGNLHHDRRLGFGLDQYRTRARGRD